MAPTPFHRGHVKLLSCLVVAPILSCISDLGGVLNIKTSTSSIPLLFLCSWFMATISSRQRDISPQHWEWTRSLLHGFRIFSIGKHKCKLGLVQQLGMVAAHCPGSQNLEPQSQQWHYRPLCLTPFFADGETSLREDRTCSQHHIAKRHSTGLKVQKFNGTLSSPLCLTRLEMKNGIFYLYSVTYFVITLAFTQKLLNSVKCTYAVLCGWLTVYAAKITLETWFSSNLVS